MIDAGTIGIGAEFNDADARAKAESFVADLRRKLDEASSITPRFAGSDGQSQTTGTAGGASASPATFVGGDRIRGLHAEHEALLRERNDLLKREIASLRSTLHGDLRPADTAPNQRTSPGYGRAALERRILDTAGHLGGDAYMDTRASDLFDQMRATTFYQRLPSEVSSRLRGNPHLRKMFRVSDVRGEAEGEDAMSELGADRYWNHIERLQGGRRAQVDRALNVLRKSPNPEDQHLAELYDNPDFAREEGQIQREARQQPRRSTSTRGGSTKIYDPDDPLWDPEFQRDYDRTQRDERRAVVRGVRRREQLDEWDRKYRADVNARGRSRESEIEAWDGSRDTSLENSVGRLIDGVFEQASQRDKDPILNSIERVRARQAQAIAEYLHADDVQGVPNERWDMGHRQRILGDHNTQGPLPRLTPEESAERNRRQETFDRYNERQRRDHGYADGDNSADSYANPRADLDARFPANQGPFLLDEGDYHNNIQRRKYGLPVPPGGRPPIDPPTGSSTAGGGSSGDPRRSRTGGGSGPRGPLDDDLVGMGNYFNLFFGISEATKMTTSLRRAEVDSMLARSPLESLEAQMNGIRTASTGIFAGIGTEAWNLVARDTPFFSPEKLEEQVAIETSRREDLDFVRDSSREIRDASELRDATARGGFAARETAIGIAARQKSEAAGEEIRQIESDLGENITSEEWNFFTGFHTVTKPKIDDDGKRASLASRRRALQAQVENASTQAAFELEQLNIERDDTLQSLTGRVGGQSAFEVERDRLTRAAGRGDREAVVQVAALNGADQRARDAMYIDHYTGLDASALRSRGSRYAAGRREIEGRTDTAIALADERDIPFIRERGKADLAEYDVEVSRDRYARRTGYAADDLAGQLSARGDNFGATLAKLTGQGLSNIALADTDDKPDEILRSFGQVRDLFASTGRENLLAARALNVSAEAIRLRMGGRDADANRVLLNEQRQAALDALPNNSIYNNFLGGNQRRSAINRQFDAAIDESDQNIAQQNEFNSRGLRFDRESAELNAGGKTLSAQATAIANQTRQQLYSYWTQRPDDVEGQSDIRATGIANLQAFRRQLLTSGTDAVEVDPSGTDLSGTNGKGEETLAEILKKLDELIQKLGD